MLLNPAQQPRGNVIAFYLLEEEGFLTFRNEVIDGP